MKLSRITAAAAIVASVFFAGCAKSPTIPETLGAESVAVGVNHTVVAYVFPEGVATESIEVTTTPEGRAAVSGVLNHTTTTPQPAE